LQDLENVGREEIAIQIELAIELGLIDFGANKVLQQIIGSLAANV
jgi:hypothetical protein